MEMTKWKYKQMQKKNQKSITDSHETGLINF